MKTFIEWLIVAPIAVVGAILLLGILGETVEIMGAHYTQGEKGAIHRR